MVTPDEIREWLYQLTPLDQAYKEYYMAHGHLLPIEELESFRQTVPEPHVTDSPVSCMDPAYFGRSLRRSGAKNMNMISNTYYFCSNEGISVRKHNNYFPPFLHTHDYIEVCYVLEGTCHQEFYCGNNVSKPSDKLTMHLYDLLIIPPGLYHTNSSVNDAVIINILVKRNAMQSTLQQFSGNDIPLFSFFAKSLVSVHSDTFLLFHLRQDDFLEELLYRLMAEYCNQQPLYPQIMSQILGLFFTTLQRNYGDQMIISHMAPVGTDYIPKFLLYLEAHYQTFSMEEMAQSFHLSPSYIARIFKRYTGETVLETLIGIRMGIAKTFLCNTDLPVYDIAELVGYEDATYFIRLFKRKYGATPRQYRAQNKADTPLLQQG